MQRAVIFSHRCLPRYPTAYFLFSGGLQAHGQSVGRYAVSERERGPNPGQRRPDESAAALDLLCFGDLSPDTDEIYAGDYWAAITPVTTSSSGTPRNVAGNFSRTPSSTT